MPRDNFEAQVSSGQGVFRLDLTPTPLVSLINSPQFLTAVAEQKSSSAYQVDVFRYDPNDEQSSGQVNKDVYHVSIGGVDSTNLMAIAGGIPSTEIDDNLREFNQRHVAFIKEPSSQVVNHHSSDMPPRVWATITST